MSKNKAAQALARMRRGIKERPSPRKLQTAKRNLAAARQKRWPMIEDLLQTESYSPDELHKAALASRVQLINEGFKYARMMESLK